MPHSNYQPDTVLVVFEATQLESRLWKGGVSLATPSDPKVKVQSLPPTLRNHNQDPISGYSKAPGVFPSSRR